MRSGVPEQVADEEARVARRDLRRYLARRLVWPDGSVSQISIVVAAGGTGLCGAPTLVAARKFDGEMAMTTYVEKIRLKCTACGEISLNL